MFRWYSAPSIALAVRAVKNPCWDAMRAGLRACAPRGVSDRAPWADYPPSTHTAIRGVTWTSANAATSNSGTTTNTNTFT